MLVSNLYFVEVYFSVYLYVCCLSIYPTNLEVVMLDVRALGSSLGFVECLSVCLSVYLSIYLSVCLSNQPGSSDARCKGARL